MNYIELNIELEKVEKELSTLPTGKLLVYPNGNWYRWFYLNQSKREYISKDNISFASTLARKEYLLLKRNVILAKLNAINKADIPIQAAEEKLLEFVQDKRYQALLNPFYSKIEDEELLSWQNSPFNSNTKYAEQLTFQCPSGNVVRSKSEVFIDMALASNAIPYRYECKLSLDNLTFYPDFTIMHPITRKLIYWEHLGMMDNDEYARQAFQKLQTYQKHNIIPGENLILIFKKKNNPFSYTNAQLALEMMNLKDFSLAL